MKKDESTLRIHLPSLDLAIDPHKMEDAYSMTAVIQVYRGLFRYGPEGDLKPDLAESWTESDDHRVFTFKLRGRTFSNGQRITPKHVILSFARIFHLGASMGADIDYIRGADAFRKSHKLSDLGIQAVSDDAVEFTLARPSAIFLKHLATADCAVLPLSDFTQDPRQDAALVASGPYRILHRSAERLEMERWRDDPLDSPKPPKRVILFKYSASSVEQLLSDGVTDSLDDDRVSAELSERLKTQGWRQFVTEISRERFVILDPKAIPEAIRRYLIGRVDPVEMKKQVNLPYLSPAYGLIPIGIPGELSREDVAQLHKELAATPAPKKGFVTLSFTQGDDLAERIATYLQKTWATPGFEVRLAPLPHEHLLQGMFKKELPLLIGGKGIDYPDGYSVLTYFKSGYDANYFRVSSPEIDRGINQLVAVFDKAERELKYRELQLQILKQYTVIPLFFGSPSSGFWGPRVAAVPPHPMGLHTLPFETIEMQGAK